MHHWILLPPLLQYVLRATQPAPHAPPLSVSGLVILLLLADEAYCEIRAEKQTVEVRIAFSENKSILLALLPASRCRFTL